MSEDGEDGIHNFGGFCLSLNNLNKSLRHKKNTGIWGKLGITKNIRKEESTRNISDLEKEFMGI